MSAKDFVNENHIKLSQEQITELLRNKSKTNKELVIKSQLPLVLSISMKFELSTSESLETLFSYGLEGVLNAVNGYTPDNGFNASFSTYATKVITNAIHHNLKMFERGIIKQRVKDRNVKNVYLFSTLNTNEDEQLFEDTIPDNNEIYNDSDDVLINELAKLLKPKELQIMILMLGLNGNQLNLTESAKVFGITKEAIRQSRLRIMNKLKKNQGFINKLKTLNGYE